MTAVYIYELFAASTDGKPTVAQKGPAVGTREGVAEESQWIRDTAASILDKFAIPRRVKAVVE